jgi:nucleoside-diphosphate-sugar epimerase
MNKDRVLILGAGGQIGVDLCLELRRIFGEGNVIASDIREEHKLLAGTGPFVQLDAMDKDAIAQVIKQDGITQIYLLAALLSATGEKDPLRAWHINMQSLLQVLDLGQNTGLKKIFWPSSIAVFGHTTPRVDTPQQTVVEPATVYGISKYAGELWCQYYHNRWGVDVRSLRYPGLISYNGAPGGGTTDYAVEIYHKALSDGAYTSYIDKGTYLPMMYMDDALRATIELMDAPAERLSTRMSYNVAAMSFAPEEIAAEITAHIPTFVCSYRPDFRQQIAEGWPQSIDDGLARNDWGWTPKFDLASMTADMLENLKTKQKVEV